MTPKHLVFQRDSSEGAGAPLLLGSLFYNSRLQGNDSELAETYVVRGQHWSWVSWWNKVALAEKGPTSWIFKPCVWFLESLRIVDEGNWDYESWLKVTSVKLLVGGWYLGSQQTVRFCHIDSLLFFWLKLELYIGCETCSDLLFKTMLAIFWSNQVVFSKFRFRVHELHVGFVLAFNLERLLWKSLGQNRNYCGCILILLWPYLFVFFCFKIPSYLFRKCLS